MTLPRIIRRFLIAWHYALNPGGETNRIRAQRRTYAETHRQLAREFGRRWGGEGAR